MFTYKGSKARELQTISEKLSTDCKTLVDVFGGSGAVSIGLQNKFDHVVYNEIQKKICRFFVFSKDINKIGRLVKICEKLTEEKCKEIFNSFLEKKKSGIPQTILEIFVFFGLNFRGQLTEMCYSKGYKSLALRAKKIMSLNNILNKIEVKNQDYKNILKKFKNDETAFLYMDPPYLSETKSTSSFYDNGKIFGTDDYLWISDFMRVCKCKVMLHIEYTAFAREELSTGLKIHAYKYNFASRPVGTNKYPHYQLMLKNY